MSQATPENGSSTSLSERSPLGKVVGRLAHALSKEISPGDVAALRRLNPSEGLSPAFFRIVADVLEPMGQLSDAGSPRRDEQERRWGAVIRIMALLAGFHEPRSGLGSELSEAGFSELRFERLLRSHGETLWDAARRMAHFLASKGSAVDQTEIARLVLSDDRADAEQVRRRLARRFYGAQHRARTSPE